MSEDARDDRYPPVKVLDLEDRVVPDNSFEEAYAIYFRLSYDPPMVWQEAFESLMRREVEQRIVSFVGPALRVVINRLENLESVLRQVADLTRRTNIKLDFIDE